MNSFHDFWTVAKFTMKDMVSRKSFRISTIIILILIVIGFNIPNLLNSAGYDDSSSDKILIIDQDDLLKGNLPENPHLEFSDANPDELRAKILNDEIQAAIILNRDDHQTPQLDYIVKNLATSAPLSEDLIHALSLTYAKTKLTNQGLSESEINSIFPTFATNISQVEEQEIGGNIVVMMLLSCILFFAIYFCAYQVSSSITIEKTSKIIETLVTSANPRSIILGKTVGIGLVGLLQILLFVTVAIFCAVTCLDPEILSQMFNLTNFTPFLSIMTLVYFILGYFAYAFAYALTGSTVSKPEEIQSANTPVVIITMIGFYLAYFTLTNPTGELNIIASILPISSPFCMPLRIMMGIAQPWEIIISVLILIIFCLLVAKIAIRIYSNAILKYGSKMSLSEIIKSYKEK